jgi:predicted PurR-regulated permease PerM
MVAIEKAGVGRTLAALISVLLVAMVVGALLYGLYHRADSFAAQLPTYSYRMRKALRPITRAVERFQEGADDLIPARNLKPAVKVSETSSWQTLLFRGAGSISNVLLIAGIAPFLAFFMLIRKERMYLHFNHAFNGKIDTARFVGRVKGLVRGYVVGNLVVGMVLSAATVVIFLIIGLAGALPLGVACGFLNTIPFLGVLLATALPLAAALLQYDSAAPFITIGISIPILHLIAVNYMIPRLIGPRLMIGPVATTVGMLFWGWLWGVMGLFLAVPLTAFLKLVADSNPRLAALSTVLAHEPETGPTSVPLANRALHKTRFHFKKLLPRS